ncbi:homologous pairing [Micractinium conductrix]|uniref:Homologous pairing n=1 Tax=Micractinium conductrix TaxID=554055 RepID=A0A2P6VAM7_9CHLO|nr:homologous pairing [Micractinium conductrix]|eukprot:PSC71156.1 homologous pairing [Micractinium conductrix]
MAAQAQAQRQEELTSVQSAELVKALLRVSIYHVSYLRGIFPEDHYKPVDMRNLDNMEIRMLLPKDPESERLVQWVEGGVAHALERRYLRKVFFGFSRDAGGKDLLEEYVFSFSYDEEGNVYMAAGGSRGGKEFSTKDPMPKTRGPTLSAVKYQVCRLMRMLVELTQTLEQVPEERYLFIKLTYTDDTPEDYEPPMFAPAADGGVGCFSRMPFVMEVGKVDTRHIKVGLAVKTVLDNVDEGGDWGEDGVHLPVADDNSALFALDPISEAGDMSEGGASGGATVGGAASGRSRPARVDTAEVRVRRDASMGGGGGYSCAPGKCGKTAAEEGEVRQAHPDSASLQSAPPRAAAAPADLAAVTAWVAGRPAAEVHVLDALARFTAIDSASLDACFEELQAQGVLVPTEEPDCYRVNKEAAAGASQQQQQQRKQKPAADALAAAEAAMAGLRVAPLDSQQGGVHDRTMSVVGKRKPAAEAGDSPSNVGGGLVFPETQPSQAGGVQFRKASLVTNLIRQGKRQRKAGSPRQAAVAGQPAPMLRSPLAAAAAHRRSSRRR